MKNKVFESNFEYDKKFELLICNVLKATNYQCMTKTTKITEQRRLFLMKT